MEFKMNEASIDGALKVLKENTRPFDLMTELENRMREFTESNLLFEDPTGAKERGRAIRLPTMIPTEITVGQQPSSQERADFEKWMSNIGGSGSVKDKLKLISNDFEKPKEHIENSSIPEILSFLMFLNYFTWMLKEFNASVAGFLWEPFLAALFGGASKQVPTSEGDIADIRIDTPTASDGEKGEPISLKILNETGQVKGSFTDMVKHFAGTEGRTPGTNMRYVIVVKRQKEEDVQGVDFYKFDINIETFFKWMGSIRHAETLEKIDKEFNLLLPGEDKNKLRRANRSYFRRGNNPDKGDSASKLVKTLYIRDAKLSADDSPVASADWVKIHTVKGDQIIAEPGVEKINLHMNTTSESYGPSRYVKPGDLLDPGGSYSATVAAYDPGGPQTRMTSKGKKVKASTPGASITTGYDEMPGSTRKESERIWGSDYERNRFANLAAEAIDPSRPTTPADFWNAVMKNAPGYLKNEQFHISPTHYAKASEHIGGLSITSRRVSNVFKLGAEQIGPQMTEMFNAMADLTDNIGRFFLTDCGDASGPKKCTKRDVKNQDKAGQTAIQNSQTLKVAVEKSVAQMKGTGETRMDYSVSPPTLRPTEE